MTTSALFMLVMSNMSSSHPRSPPITLGSRSASPALPVLTSSSLIAKTSTTTTVQQQQQQQQVIASASVVATELRDPRLKANAEFVARLKRENPKTHEGTTILFMYLGVPSYIETALFQCRIWNLYSRIVLVTDQTSLSSAEFVKGEEKKKKKKNVIVVLFSVRVGDGAGRRSDAQTCMDGRNYANFRSGRRRKASEFALGKTFCVFGSSSDSSGPQQRILAPRS